CQILRSDKVKPFANACYGTGQVGQKISRKRQVVVAETRDAGGAGVIDSHRDAPGAQQSLRCNVAVVPTLGSVAAIFSACFQCVPAFAPAYGIAIGPQRTDGSPCGPVAC